MKQKEFFKKLYPNKFSDSKIIRTGQLNREFFSFFLETLTSEGREKEFEDFARKLCEVEICPNLLPQTGPTGGGDSKVDTETYPVSADIAMKWYQGNDSAANRWAFAISAKKDWRSKVKSDVRKIVDINDSRGYNKIFFISNQYISDKKRAEVEDLLKAENEIEIRILDRNWILEKTFNNNNKDIAIASFKLSEGFRDEVEMGSEDYKRTQRLNKVERLIIDNSNHKELINLCSESIILSRELEVPKERIMGVLERGVSVVSKYGTIIDKMEIIYLYAWTIFWWYPDDEIYYKKYLELESLVKDKPNIHFISKLVTLWISLYPKATLKELEIQIEAHTNFLLEQLESFARDEKFPNAALEAQANIQVINTIRGKDINHIVDSFINIISKSRGKLDFNLNTISKLIIETDIYSEAERYDELFEMLVKYNSEKTSNISSSRLLIKRGDDIQDDSPMKAMQYYSRALEKIAYDESKQEFVRLMASMANIFENKGLLWSARNYYINCINICFNSYFKEGIISPLLILATSRLKFIELKLGQLFNAIETYKIENIAIQIYTSNMDKYDFEDKFDYILGIQLLKLPLEELSQLEHYPDYLIELDLPYSKMALMYNLGHYDEDMLSEMESDKGIYDDFMLKWINQPANKELKIVPTFGLTALVELKTKILGCEVIIKTQNLYKLKKVSYNILSSLESFFVTGLNHDLYPLANNLILEIKEIDDYDSQYTFEINEKNSRIAILTISKNFNDYELETLNKGIFEEIFAYVVSSLFPYESFMKKIENIVVKEDGFIRASMTLTSIEQYYIDKKDLKSDDIRFKRYELLRVTPINIELKDERENVSRSEIIKELKFERPPEDLYENAKHDEILISSITNVNYWNEAEWKGLAVKSSADYSFPPIVSPVYLNEYGKKIFEEWKAKYGDYDSSDEIIVGIIKGISKKNPFWYRVIIGNDFDLKNFMSEKDYILISNIQRIHTMEATSDYNLNLLITTLGVFDTYFLVPAIFDKNMQNPDFHFKLGIRKNKCSLRIINAYEITEKDIFFHQGILPNDDIIIPNGIKNDFIVDLINRKKD